MNIMAARGTKSKVRVNVGHLGAMVWCVVGAFLISGCLAESEVCQSPETMSPDTMAKHLHLTAVPRGKFNAGFFQVDRTIKDAAECIISCCEDPLCNVAWFTQGQCYTIECHETKEHDCDPVKQSEPMFNDTLFIQVRSLNDTKKADECDLSLEDACENNQICAFNDNLVTRCDCLPGFKRNNSYSKTCVKDSSSEPSVNAGDSEPDHTNPVSMVNKDCEIGVTFCGANKVCYIPKDSKSRNGVCQCVKGYSEDKEGTCVKQVQTKVTEATTTTTEALMTATGTRTEEVTAVHTTPKPTPKPTPKSTTPKVEELTVSVGDNKVIQLPDDQVTLTAFVLPEQSKDDPYHYEWTLEARPEGSESGTMEGKYTNTFTLNELIAGLYTFQVKVTGTNKYGEAHVNVTVKPPARENKAPVAVVRPAELEVKLPNTAILDGSESTDDDKIASYKWEMVKGPITDNTISGDKAILNLKDLVPGSYTFMLTVTDSDGETNSTTAEVTVIKETDYPPKANAGSDIVVYLPQNYVTLYGNQSTDDKGIVSYEWVKTSGDSLPADMSGTRTSELHLSNLEVGDYIFTLKVTDESNQESTAQVHVYVKPEANAPPKAKTAGSLDVSLPVDFITLDGSNSTDDMKVTSYLWQQTDGPSILNIKDADKIVASVSGDIKQGTYQFKLTVKDKQELQSTAKLTVTVKKVANEAPVARAGGDREITLPRSMVSLDGSKSSDDRHITEYHWVRGSSSLAAGDIVNNSDSEAVLQLVNLVAGRYVFTLTVLDAEGASDTDQASILVKEDPHKIDLLELELEADITEFTDKNKNNLQNQLALLLPPQEGEIVIDIQSISEDPSNGNLRVLFYAIDKIRDMRTYRSGVSTLAVLKEKLMSSPYVLEFKVAGIDTLVCQKNCSNHGHCDMKTRQCVCEAFWTKNIFLYMSTGEANCDWSILYVVIVCFLCVIALTGAVWACVYCWQRRRCRCNRCRVRSKKRHRYSLLNDEEEERVELKSGKSQTSSLMMSDSDFSSEEETLFVNQKKTNGHIGKLNGVSKQHLKTKLRT